MEQKDIKRLIKALMGVGVLLLLVIIIKPQNYIKISDNPPAEKESKYLSQYEWQDEVGVEKHKDIVWNKIKESRLSGLTSADYVIAEEEGIDCYWADESCRSLLLEYLRREGGLSSRYYFLTIAENNEVKTIKSSKELREFFTPVESEAEAMSFIGVTITDIKKNKGDVLVGETAVVDDGYLVKVVENHTFGCGRHDPQKVIFKITNGGEISVVALEVLPPEPENTPYSCVD